MFKLDFFHISCVIILRLICLKVFLNSDYYYYISQLVTTNVLNLLWRMIEIKALILLLGLKLVALSLVHILLIYRKAKRKTKEKR